MGSDSDYDPSSESDMEDPDSVEVPGGGKSLKDIQLPTEKSIGQVQSPNSSSVVSNLEPKAKRMTSDKVILPTVDIKPVSISRGELQVNAASIPGSSSSPGNPPPSRYSNMSDFELANLPISADRPLTAAEFFQLVLPKRFFVRLMEQVVAREISVEEVNGVMLSCRNQALLHLLFTIVMNQEEPASATAINSEFNMSGLASLPKMAPAEVFRYFCRLSIIIISLYVPISY